jgi:hypothetical protein
MLVSHTVSRAVLDAVTCEFECVFILYCTAFVRISVALWPSVRDLKCA